MIFLGKDERRAGKVQRKNYRLWPSRLRSLQTIFGELGRTQGFHSNVMGGCAAYKATRAAERGLDYSTAELELRRTSRE